MSGIPKRPVKTEARSQGSLLPARPSARPSHPRLLQLLPVGKVAQALEPEGNQELLGGHERIGRAAAGGSWPGPDQALRMQPPDQVAADLLAEDVLQPVAGDRLMVGDG